MKNNSVSGLNPEGITCTPPTVDDDDGGDDIRVQEFSLS